MFRHRQERRRERQLRATVRDAVALRPRLVAALAVTDDTNVLGDLLDAVSALDEALKVLAPDEATTSIFADTI